MAHVMRSKEIIEIISKQFEGVVPKSSWGETSLFYNPGRILTNGVYFSNKKKNGDNDKASGLDRDGVYRLSIGISITTFQTLFGQRSKRPPKGGIVDTGHDFTAQDILMPHPIYGWMAWIQILNPSKNTFKELLPLIAEAHANAVIKFNKKTAKPRGEHLRQAGRGHQSKNGMDRK